MIGRGAALLVLTAISGCQWLPERVEFVCPPIPETVRPVLPRISADELQCLGDDTYRKLMNRETIRREYAEDLEAIIHVIREECPR